MSGHPGGPWPHLAGVGLTRFGRHEGRGALELMAQAAQSALDDAGLAHAEVDGLLCGYATTVPHLMLSTLFAERFGLRPEYAHAVQLGGATGATLVMLAGDLVRAGRCRHVLVVAGENRLTGQSRDSAIQTLAQVGDAEIEVPNGGSVPSYYALMASMYLHATGTTEADLAELAVCMRRHAQAHPGAHLQADLSAADVMASRPIATPLKLADCCPISDGAAAFVVSADPGPNAPVRLIGAGQAHRHQHLVAMADVRAVGAREAAGRALCQAGCTLADIGHVGLYDSFTITLAMMLEELGLAQPAQAGALARAGQFDAGGRWPLNLHGGLLSYGHCGVAGGMAHVAEAVVQLRGAAGQRQAPLARHALVHADGGVMSSHVSLVLEAPDTVALRDAEGVVADPSLDGAPKPARVVSGALGSAADVPAVAGAGDSGADGVQAWAAADATGATGATGAADATLQPPVGPADLNAQAEEALHVLRCGPCGATASGRRLACPSCGSVDLRSVPSQGRGRIVAVSQVHRAPTPAWREAAPYTLVLVDLDEGARTMAHAKVMSAGAATADALPAGGSLAAGQDRRGAAGDAGHGWAPGAMPAIGDRVQLVHTTVAGHPVWQAHPLV